MPRQPSDGLFRIYTSITNAAYTIELSDISNAGAFIRNRHLPRVGEVITFVVVDDSHRDRFVGNARVVWLKEAKDEEDCGFGIEFEKAIGDEILKTLLQEP